MSCVNTSLPEYKALAKKFNPFELQLVIMQYQSDSKTDNFPSEDFIKDAIGYSDQYLKERNKGLDDTTSLELAKTLSERFKVPYEVISESDLARLYPDVDNDVNSFWDGTTNKVMLISGRFNGSTVFHEFTHPLVEYIYQNNKTLYTYLINQLSDANGNRLSYLQVRKYLADKGYQVGRMEKADVYKEALTHFIQAEANAMSKGLLTEPTTLYQKFWNFIKKILETLNPYISKIDVLQIPRMSFNEIAQYIFTSDGLDLSNIRAQNKYYELNENISEIHTEAYTYQAERLGDNLTEAQIEEAKKLMLNSAEYESFEDFYIKTSTGKKLNRVSGQKKSMKGPQNQENYFAFDEDENQYWERREFGNQVNDIVDGIVRGLSFEDALTYVREKQNERQSKNTNPDINILNAVVKDDVLENIYNELSEVLNDQFADYMLIPQVVFGSNKMGVAGTADIVAIAPDGRIKIIDTKSAKYRALTENGNITYEYSRQHSNKTRASKLEGYRAQLSFYKGMALENGFVFEDSDELALLPVALTNDRVDGVTNDNVISDAVVEGVLSVDGYDYIISLFKEGKSKEYTEEQKNILDSIKLKVLERIEILKRNPHVKGKKFRERELANLYEVVSTVERSKALFSFIEDAYSNLVKKEVKGKKYSIKGAVDKINEVKGKYAAGKLTADETLEELFYYKTLAELYKPVISEIQSVLLTELGKGFQIGSDNEGFLMIKDVIAAITNIETDYKKNAIPIIADILYEQVEPGLNEKVEQAISELRNELADVQGKYGLESKEYKVKKKEYDYWLKKSRTENGVTKDYLIKILQSGSEEDISWLDSRLSPAISSNNELISLSSKIIKERFENARQESIEVIQGAEEAFKTYSKNTNMNNVAEFNKPFYEVVEVYDGLDTNGKAKFRKEYHFVQQLDMNAYQKKYAELKEKIATVTDEKTKRNLYKEFFRQNHRLRPKNDIVIKNPQIPGESIVLIKGLDTLIKEKRKLVDEGIETETDFENYLERMKGKTENNITYYDSEFTIPDFEKFENQKYKSMNLSQKAYYNFMVATYFKAQERGPLMPTYRIPSVAKSGFERTLEKGVLNYLNYIRKDSFQELSEDIDRYGETRTSSGVKIIPMLYSNEMNIDDVSLDLLSSVLKYDSASLIYEAQSKSQPFAESILSVVKETLPKQTDSLGRKTVNKLAQKIPGISDNLKFLNVEDGTNNIYFLMNAFFDTQVYGIKRIPYTISVGNTVIKVDKVADMIKGFASKTQIGGFNLLGGIANSLQANVSTMIEAAAKQYISDKSMVWAKKEYYKNSMAYINDLRTGVATSFLGQLSELYDPMQGNYRDQYGRRISKTMFKKLMSTNSWYFLHKAGEHAIQTQMFLAFLKDTKILIDGKESSLYDAYELGSNGKIKLKEGVKLPGKLSKNGLVSITMQNRIHAINKRVNGVYNEFDSPELKRHWYGSLLFMYRDYLVPGFKRRYKSLTMDQEYSDYNEGYWRTFFRVLKSDYKKLARYSLGLDKPNTVVGKFERENVARAARELAIIFGTGMLAIILNSLMKAADDEDKDKFKHLLYLTMKLNQELGAYGTIGDPQNWGIPNVQEIFRTLSQPTVAYGTVKRLFKVYTILTTDPLGVYQKETGIFEKGDSKLLAALMKLFGITGVNFDPEESIKYMKMSNK